MVFTFHALAAWVVAAVAAVAAPPFPWPFWISCCALVAAVLLLALVPGIALGVVVALAVAAAWCRMVAVVMAVLVAGRPRLRRRLRGTVLLPVVLFVARPIGQRHQGWTTAWARRPHKS